MAVFVSDIRIERDRKGLFIVTRRPPASCPTFRLVGMVSGFAILAATPSAAETLESALAKAYQGNPTLNASRAGVRAIDENVAIAQSGYRPQVNVGAAIGVQYLADPQSAAPCGRRRIRRHRRDDGRHRSRAGRGRLGQRQHRHVDRDRHRRSGTTGLGTSTARSHGSAGADRGRRCGLGRDCGDRGESPRQTITSSRTVRTTYLPSTREPDGLADALQRLPDRQPDPARRVDRLQPARDAAVHGADGALQRRSGVHERAQQHGDAGAEPEQRRGAGGAAPADARPLQRRRGHAHGRRPGRGPARRRTLAGQRGRIRPAHQHRHLPAEHRRRAAPARAGPAAGPVRPGQPRRRHRHRPARASADRVGHPRRRCRRGAGEGAGGPAGAAASACRAPSVSSTTRTARTRASSSGSWAAG